MDSVNNRSLFRRKSQAARNKVREMGRVREPQGILSAFPELMAAASRPRPMMMQQPARFQQGGTVTPPAPSLMERFAATMALPMGQSVDIAATPTPRESVEVPDIATMVRQNLGDNEAAQAQFSELEAALTDPEVTNEQRQKAITSAAGVENTRDGLRDVVSRITGREQPASATVDELNRAITGVALGGAIGGPRSVAARISEALLVGLQAQRETATARESEESAIRRATLSGGGSGARDFRSPTDAYQDAYQSILNRTEDFNVPEGMTREQYAQNAAMGIIRDSYTPEQLAGTRFAGIHSTGTGATTSAPVSTPVAISTQAQFDALPSGTRYVDAETGVIGVKP